MTEQSPPRRNALPLLRNVGLGQKAVITPLDCDVRLPKRRGGGNLSAQAVAAPSISRAFTLRNHDGGWSCRKTALESSEKNSESRLVGKLARPSRRPVSVKSPTQNQTPIRWS